MPCEGIDRSDEVTLANKRIVPQYVIGHNGAAQDNVVWEKGKWLAYTSTNKIIIELMEGTEPDSRKQVHVSCSADRIEGLTLSPNHKLLAGYSRQAMYAGSTSVYVVDTQSWATISHITIPQPTIRSAEFSPNSNILMILTTGVQSDSTLHFYDPLAPELLVRSAVPHLLTAATWNTFSSSGLEFVVMNDKKYEFWRLTPELTLQYQDGKLFAENADLTTLNFSEPIIGLGTILLGIGKENGSVDIVDTRTNSPMASVQLFKAKITLLQWKQQRLIFATNDNSIYSVPINSQEYYFLHLFVCVWKKQQLIKKIIIIAIVIIIVIIITNAFPIART